MKKKFMTNKEIVAATKLLGMRSTKDTKTLMKMCHTSTTEKPESLTDYIQRNHLETKTYTNKKGNSVTQVTFPNGVTRCWATEHLATTFTYGN